VAAAMGFKSIGVLRAAESGCCQAANHPSSVPWYQDGKIAARALTLAQVPSPALRYSGGTTVVWRDVDVSEKMFVR